ncbi:hypothetical protein [Geomicrobium sediminis]|uniref:Oxidoreductase n=1 Tax=Geomicrobium sediminis TaxID=1347788 RepID=A0ABS2PG13_9BACL|nr:hypothetical protein [Geomicrobium sediminis]MBM7634036.1 hypothetical protein [Geomicrobium sediminis]
MLENGMLLPDKYLDPVEPMEIGNCEGCVHSVYDGEDHLEFDDVLLHDDTACIANYVRDVSEAR